MAGNLKASSTRVSDDGKSVIVETQSTQTAHELAAELENRVRAKEGGPGARANVWLRNSLDRFDETLGIYADRRLQIASNILMICLMALAVFAWYFVLPGYEAVMCVIGAVLAFTLKQLAADLDRAWVVKKNGMFAFFCVCIVTILVVECVASASLQSFVAERAATGQEDIGRRINMLTAEQERLNEAQKVAPKGTPDQTQALVDAFSANPMVNREGAQLTKTVGSMVKETGCKGNSYYVGIYCPTYLELKGDVDYAKQWHEDKARLQKIPAEIKEAELARPRGASTMSLGLGVIVPVGLTFLLGAFTVFIAYLAGRAKRTPLPQVGGN
jgi:hypothetical protein